MIGYVKDKVMALLNSQHTVSFDEITAATGYPFKVIERAVYSLLGDDKIKVDTTNRISKK